MNKIFVGLMVAAVVSVGIVFASEKFCGIGSRLMKDPYNKKFFILEVYPNTPSYKYGLPEGAELIAINDQKIKKLSVEQAVYLIRGVEGTKVKLTTKYNNTERTFEIPREQIEIQEETDDKFELHWKQVAPPGLAHVKPMPRNIINNVSRRWYNENIPTLIYWVNRKEAFKNGYNVCMTYSKDEQNTCLMNLVNREIAKTDSDRQIELQEQMMRQQAVQNFSNAINQMQTNNHLNNINNSLQQQNFQLQNTNIQLQNTNTNLYYINKTLRGW